MIYNKFSNYKQRVCNQLLIAFLCIYASNLLIAQTPYCDSIIHKINNNQEDSCKVELINKLVIFYLNNGYIHLAKPYINSGKRISEKINYQKGIAQYYNSIGILFRNSGNNKVALENYNLALQIARTINNLTIMASCHHNMARIYDNQGDYLRALDHLQTALKIKEQLKDTLKMANTLGHIGNIYSILNDQKALDMYFKALQFETKVGNYPGMSIALNNIGSYFEKNKNYKKALQYFNRGLNISKTIGYVPEIANSYNHIGNINGLSNNLKHAIDNYSEALILYKKLRNNENISEVQYNIGTLKFKEKKWSEAKYYFNQCFETAKKSSVLKRIKDAHYGLSMIYKQIQKYDLALSHFQNYTILKDSVYNQDIAKKLITLTMTHEFEKEQQHRKSEEQKKESKLKAQIETKKIQIYALVITLVLLALAVFLLIRDYRQKQKLKVTLLKNKIATDLHDEIGSALSSISMNAGIAKLNKHADSQAKIIEKIEVTSRNTIDSMSDIVWFMKTKNESIELILEKMKRFGEEIAFAKNFSFQFTTHNFDYSLKADMNQCRHFYLIYKEAIHNIAKYAQANHVSISIEKNNLDLIMRIYDDGIGFDLEQNKNKGNGLQHMFERAKILRSILTIRTNLNQGTEIIFHGKFSTLLST